MGASTFYEYGSGPTAKKAFRSAVDESQYENGHGGYSGSLAEKQSFVMCHSEPVTSEVANQMADDLIEADDGKISDKWGPAGCIEIIQPEGKERKFLFFGWASS